MSCPSEFVALVLFLTAAAFITTAYVCVCIYIYSVKSAVFELGRTESCVLSTVNI